MEKTEMITLAGCSFYINKEALEVLTDYIERMKRRFATAEGGDEIVSDIEVRIAEVFYESTNKAQRPVTREMVDKAMQIMGNPDTGFAESEGESKEKSYNKQKVQRKLYRNVDSKLLGGVCSGLATYLAIDVVLVRLLFVLTLALPIYIVLLIVIRPADTPLKRREMIGEHEGIDNFWESVNRFCDNGIAKYNSFSLGVRVMIIVGVAVLFWIAKPIVIIALLSTLFFVLLLRTKNRKRRLLYLVLIIILQMIDFNIHLNYTNHYGF